jgi:long-chain acyl-CoA synthetase
MTSISVDTYPWLTHYAEGVPFEINPDAFGSLIDLMESAFEQHAERAAYANLGKEITFGKLDELTRNFAAYLQSIGLKKGDRIAIQMPNCLQFPVSMFGALRAGLVVVSANPLYTPREMQHQFKDSGAKAIVILANYGANLQKIIAQTDIEHVIVTEIGDLLGFPKKLIVNTAVKYFKKMVPDFHIPGAVSMDKALTTGKGLSYSKPNVSSIEMAFIQYTGGTTGVSKGAMLTHRNLVSNLEMNAAWIEPMMREIKIPIIVTALPLCHVYALTVNALQGLRCGGMNLLITNPRDLNAFISDLKKYKFNIFPGLNTLFNSLLNHPRIKEVDFSNLKVTTAGGMALQKVVMDRWLEVTGSRATEGYGLSETSPVLSSNVLMGENRVGTIGVPWPSTRMRILREDGTWAEPDEVGEICASGPQVMLGYYNRPDETVKVFLEDSSGRWFKTGDIGIQSPDGFFKIVDRKKDMILVSGFNVYPNEIEEVVAQCPGVLEVACVGIPDEKSGEIVKVYIVKKDPDLTEEKVRAFCKENLTPYKCPRKIEFRNDLPKTNVGKILRKALREQELTKSKV